MSRRAAAAAAAAAGPVACEDDDVGGGEWKHEPQRAGGAVALSVPAAAGAGMGAGSGMPSAAMSSAAFAFGASCHTSAFLPKKDAATAPPLAEVIKPPSPPQSVDGRKQAVLKRREEAKNSMKAIQDENYLRAKSFGANPEEIPLAGFVGEFVSAASQEAAAFSAAMAVGRLKNSGSVLLWAPGVTVIVESLRRLHPVTAAARASRWRYAVNALMSNGCGKVLQLLFVGVDPTFADPSVVADKRNRSAVKHERGFANIEARAVAGFQLPMLRPVTSDKRIDDAIKRFNTLRLWDRKETASRRTAAGKTSSSAADDSVPYGAWPVVIRTAIPQADMALGQVPRTGVQEPFYVSYTDCDRRWGVDALSAIIYDRTKQFLGRVVVAVARRFAPHAAGVTQEQKAHADALQYAMWKALFSNTVLFLSAAIVSCKRDGPIVNRVGGATLGMSRGLATLMLCEPQFSTDFCPEVTIIERLRVAAIHEPSSQKPVTGVFLDSHARVMEKLSLAASLAARGMTTWGTRPPATAGPVAQDSAKAAAKLATDVAEAVSRASNGRRCLLAPCVDSGVAVPFFVDSDAMLSGLGNKERIADDAVSQAFVECLGSHVDGLAFPLATLKANVDSDVSPTASPKYYTTLAALWNESCVYHAALDAASRGVASAPPPPSFLVAEAAAFRVQFVDSVRVECSKAARNRLIGDVADPSKRVTVAPASVMQFMEMTKEQKDIASADIAAAMLTEPGQAPLDVSVCRSFQQGQAPMFQAEERCAAPRPTFEHDGLFGPPPSLSSAAGFSAPVTAAAAATGAVALPVVAAASVATTAAALPRAVIGSHHTPSSAAAAAAAAAAPPAPMWNTGRFAAAPVPAPAPTSAAAAAKRGAAAAAGVASMSD